MARKKAPGIKEDLNPNLIPMVDIMFLLLLFFMLGADMSQREQADLILPTASEIKEDEKVKSPEPTTTVNIQHRQSGSLADCPARYCREDEHWAYVIQGRDIPVTELRDKLKAAADEALEPDVDPIAGERLSARKLIIRADKAAPYGMVNKVIELAGGVKLYKIEVGAAVPPKG